MSAQHVSRAMKLGLLGMSIAGCMVFAHRVAFAQAYTPEPIVPTPEVYLYLQENPALDGIYGHQITGQFTSLTIFGNSYADWGNAAAAGFPPGISGTATKRYGNALSMGDAMQFHYDLPTGSVANYAVGGAESGLTNINPFPALANSTGIESQINVFLAAGGHFGPTDLVDITTVGGNDLLNVLFDGLTGAVARALAAEKIDVSLLAGAGARTLAILSGDDVSLLPAVAPGGILAAFVTPAAAHEFFIELFPKEEQAFAHYNRSPTRIFFFDLAALERRILADPAQFGFTTTATACIASPACLAAPVAVQDETLTYDGLHYTTRGFAWISQYEANQIDAPSTIAAQAELGLADARAVSGAVFERLDVQRTAEGAQPGGSGASPLSVYIQGTDVSGRQNDQLFALGARYSAPGVTAGLDDHINPNLLVGLAFNYSSPRATLDQGFGTVKMSAEQVAGYGSWSIQNYFVDFTAVAGHGNYSISRLGVFDAIDGKTSGSDVVVAAKAGDLLLGIGSLRAGPILGLDYATVHENGYTESGDWLLSQVVGGQTLNSLVGRAGAELRWSGTSRDIAVNSFLDLTADHEFLDATRNIITSQLSTPEITVATPVAANPTRTYGQIVAGVSVEMTYALSVQGSVATEFGGGAGAWNFGAEGGILYRF
jgi:phospholipase/lecithinase/hemolysin/uncharacterized protein YhjY with autotransporter beta-barrel domain